MRRVALVVAGALTLAPGTGAKEFASLVVVGSDGRSFDLRTAPAVIDQLFSSTEPAAAGGGYFRLFPLASGGHVGVPGRYYPATRAVCLGWDQSRPPRGCRRPERALLALLARAATLAPFRGPPTTVAVAESESVPTVVASQLRVAFELAFDRAALARPARAARTCRRFIVRWRGPKAASRPRTFCLSPDGVRARGVLRPLGVDPWSLANVNACPRCGSLRSIRRARVSILYPAGWHTLTVDRHVTNPALRFQLSTEPGASAAGVGPSDVVVRVEELVPPLLRPQGTSRYPRRPVRFTLATFRRSESWPRGLGTAFRERGRVFYVWVALGSRDAVLRARVEGMLDTLAVG